jgi:hypothetical protein
MWPDTHTQALEDPHRDTNEIVGFWTLEQYCARFACPTGADRRIRCRPGTNRLMTPGAPRWETGTSPIDLGDDDLSGALTDSRNRRQQRRLLGEREGGLVHIILVAFTSIDWTGWGG